MSAGVMAWACAVYGVAPTGTCDDDNRCAACLDCARAPGAGTTDAGNCRPRYDACVGENESCGPSYEACCAFDECFDACGNLDDAAAWACICGSDSLRTCAVDTAPPGSCAGDHPEGAAVALGPDGWLVCARDVCETSCAP